eukprot:CAMPEP_0118934330 /NCGR_PEP_ID=MMETSP1169-20130426/13764_1 /TAXON_ID=36882 /ORGANISM="Pyramimonas obovata, Strain CCMP722" /LENGTH=114 /DNA_ID=CAMNT_0006877225 /DNA_START=317 /DNA_END=661 /DNA_ORIENTATION=+
MTSKQSTAYSPKPGKSSMGRQVLSNKRTNGGCSFGKATRNQICEHTFITEEHSRHGQTAEKGTPAAVYEVPGSLGKQTLKGRRTAPAYQVGKSQRFAEVPDYTPRQTPGPGAYE